MRLNLVVGLHNQNQYNKANKMHPWIFRVSRSIDSRLDHVIFTIAKPYSELFLEFLRDEGLTSSIQETVDDDPLAFIRVQYIQNRDCSSLEEQTNALKNKFLDHLSTRYGSTDPLE